MCSQSVSGSSLLSGYDEDDVRETSGRSRRDFEEIDAVLYDEETPKRSSIKKISEEWSGKPHFRIVGRPCPMELQSETSRMETINTTPLSSLDSASNINTNELRVSLTVASTRDRKYSDSPWTYFNIEEVMIKADIARLAGKCLDLRARCVRVRATQSSKSKKNDDIETPSIPQAIDSSNKYLLACHRFSNAAFHSRASSMMCVPAVRPLIRRKGPF